jgi:hypothetical protein
MTVVAVTEAITSLTELENRFGLQQSGSAAFFPEWQESLPALTSGEQNQLDQIKASYLYNAADGAMTEGTVNLLLVSPLLYLAGFCHPPYRLRAEQSVEISTEESNLTLRGRIEALILQSALGQRFWLTLVESKQTKFSFSIAIPQALTYMMAAPTNPRPLFGLVTNGDGFLFIKLDLQQRYYDFSRDYSVYAKPDNDLYQVLRVLKKIGSLMSNTQAV